MTNDGTLNVNFGHIYYSKKHLVGLDKIINVLVALSLLLIGADLLAFKILDVSIRISQFILILCFLFMLSNGKYKLRNCIPLFFFLVSSLLSTILSFSFFRSVLFYFSILYNVFFIFYLFSSYIYCYGLDKFIRLFRITSYILFSLLLFQALAFVLFDFKITIFPAHTDKYMGIPRVSLWFYEPSYLATYLIFWLSISLYNLLVNTDKSYIKDTIMCLLLFALAASTTGYIGIIGVFFVTFLISLKKGFSGKKLFVLLAIIVFGIIGIVIFKDSLAIFFARLFNSSLNAASGGRITTMIEGINVWLEYNPVLGVGPGSYGIYVANDPTRVTNNLSTDLLSSLGILGLITFYFFHFWLIAKGIKTYKKNKNPYLPAMLIGLISFIVLLQANNGYLRLYHWMFLGAIYGTIHYLEIERSIDTSIKVQLLE